MCEILICLLKGQHIRCENIFSGYLHYPQEEILARCKMLQTFCSLPVASIFLSKRNVNVKCKRVTGKYVMLSLTPEDAKEWHSHLVCSICYSDLPGWLSLATCDQPVFGRMLSQLPSTIILAGQRFVRSSSFPFTPTPFLPGKLLIVIYPSSNAFSLSHIP